MVGMPILKSYPNSLSVMFRGARSVDWARKPGEVTHGDNEMRSRQDIEENFQVIDHLRRIERFQPFSDRDLAALMELAQFHTCTSGEVIIQEGEYDCWVYILLSGRLEVVKSGKTIRYLGRAGDMFGVMGVIDGSPRSATVRTVGEAQVLGIDASVIDRELQANHFHFCYIVYRLFSEVLAVRLRETSEENISYRTALARFGNV